MTVHVDHPIPTLSPIPNIRGAAEAARWITEKLGIAMSKDYVLRKSKSGDIPYAVIQGARHYSSQALYDYIMSHNKTGEKQTNTTATDPWKV